MRFCRSNSDQTIDVRADFRWAIRAAFGIALLWHPALAGASNEIGNVNNVMNVAYGTMPTQSRAELHAGEQVVSNHVLETTTGAALHIKFIDNSDFHLGSDSRATLDRFLYDPQSQGGQMSLLLKEGIFRFKTGQMKASGIQVVTAVAIITPKGTEFIVQVLASREIIVSVLSGAVEITPLAQTSGPVTISAPDTAQVFGNGVMHGGVDPPAPDPGIEIHTMIAALETTEPLVTEAGPTEEPSPGEGPRNGPNDTDGPGPGPDGPGPGPDGPGPGPDGPGPGPDGPDGPGDGPGGPDGPGDGPGGPDGPGDGPGGPGDGGRSGAEKSRAGGLDGTNPGRGRRGPDVGRNNPNRASR